MIEQRIEVLRLADLKGQSINARSMQGETFRTLVENIRRDGCMTQIPLVRVDHDNGGHIILSGHHRIKAALAAGIEEDQVQVVVSRMTPDEERMRVLSHNSLTGDDDPEILRKMYDSIIDVDMRQSSGLDDKEMGLVPDVVTDGLNEANLDFTTVMLVFLPHELERAERALKDARERASSKTWVASSVQYDEVMKTLESVSLAHNIGNVAAQMGVWLDIVDRHWDDLQEGWLGEEKPLIPAKKKVPMETLFGSRLVPVEAAFIIARAGKLAASCGDVKKGDLWKFVEQLAVDYIAAKSGIE